MRRETVLDDDKDTDVDIADVHSVGSFCAVNRVEHDAATGESPLPWPKSFLHMVEYGVKYGSGGRGCGSCDCIVLVSLGVFPGVSLTTICFPCAPSHKSYTAAKSIIMCA